MSLTELPFGLPGRIYRSPMPFGTYDIDGQIFDAYKMQSISVIVVLAEKTECLQKAHRDLESLYRAEGWTVLSAPIPDFGIPDIQKIHTTLTDTMDFAKAGQHVAVHCSAGIGRTGLFSALLARKVFGYPGEQAITWVRQHIPGAAETHEQREFVTSFTF